MTPPIATATSDFCWLSSTTKCVASWSDGGSGRLETGRTKALHLNTGGTPCDASYATTCFVG
eukprot:8618-Eustigmatos_ZCMA.PRE.1